jgi:archaellum biogenesis ATPase FlaH
MWVIEAMLAEPESTQHEPERHATSYTRKARTGEEWSNEEWALSYLSALNPTHTDDYDSWLAVGMALHSVNDSLLIEWDDWSRQSAKYKPGCCDKKWKSFNRQGVAIGSLAHMAKQDGWRSPFEKASGRGYTGGIGSGSGGDGGNTVHQKLPIREAIAKAEQILKTQISSQLDPIEVSILLEEVRREAGVNEYNWEKNYLKPLREKLERSLALPNTVNQPIAQTDPSERLRLELLTLIKETDPIKKVRKRAEIASHYRISKGEIEFLCRTLEGDSKTPKAKFFALDDFLSIESEGIDYLIPGLLPRGETVLCSGLPKSGKTLLAIDAAFAIATGESHFLGEAVQQGKVLLVSVDESAQSTKAKLIKRGFRPRDTASIAVMTTWDISQLDALEAKLEVFRPDVVVIDSLKRITAGREISENSAEFADIIYTLKELLTQYSAAGILIHHSNKNPEATGVSRVRGSTAIAGAVWGIWQMDIPESEDESDGKPSKGKPKQKRFDPTNPNRVFTAICRDTEGALLNIKFNPENHSYVISDGDATAQSERKTQEQVILDILAQVAPKGLTGREIMEYSGLGRGIYSVLNRMVDKRIITQRQSSTDARMTVYCLPKKQGTHTPPHSDLLCDQYSLNSPTGMDLEIDHKLITTPEELITNFCKNDQKNRDAINSNPEPAPPPVEIDHKNTDRGGVCECAEYVEVDDPWIDEKPADVLLQLAQPEAIASKPQEVWAWNRETGECLGQVLYDGDNRLKIRRTGEPASRAKWHERNQITFKNPTVSALSLNTSATTPVQWEDSEQFLEEFED